MLNDELIPYILEKNLDKYSYTIILHHITVEEALDEVEKKISNFEKNKGKISDHKKSYEISKRLYTFKNMLSNFEPNDKLNIVIILNVDLKYFEMTNEIKNHCKIWKIKKFSFYYNDDVLDSFSEGTISERLVQYVSILLTTEKVKTIFDFSEGSKFKVKEIDSLKSRSIEDIQESEENLSISLKKYNPVIIFGNKNLIKEKEKNCNTAIPTYISNNLNKKELLVLIENIEIKSNQEKFKKIFLDNYQNPKFTDKFLIGSKENSYGIENYMIKTLFINPKLMNKFKKNSELLNLLNNVNVIIVQPKEAGDYGQILNKNYGGIVGEKYY